MRKQDNFAVTETADLICVTTEMNSHQKKIYGYKTLRGAFAMLKRQNKIANKFGIKLSFTINLPIKE